MLREIASLHTPWRFFFGPKNHIDARLTPFTKDLQNLSNQSPTSRRTMNNRRPGDAWAETHAFVSGQSINHQQDPALSPDPQAPDDSDEAEAQAALPHWLPHPFPDQTFSLPYHKLPLTSPVITSFTSSLTHGLLQLREAWDGNGWMDSLPSSGASSKPVKGRVSRKERLQLQIHAH
ncbi:hypothetical protein GX51_00926 [Blastomyces parvus]|uniref:Uncharacterized protein n=1 Tax=Blastomyces parvus TaxID=2060905 RepID=A0A2B7XKJ2_9EURO|nr:hypothetical protein GX51_00926 [Blastomyces parvus]